MFQFRIFPSTSRVSKPWFALGRSRSLADGACKIVQEKTAATEPSTILSDGPQPKKWTSSGVLKSVIASVQASFSAGVRTRSPQESTAPTSSNLDLLRTIAVLLVLGEHLFRRIHIEKIGWVQVTSLGLFGVLLFFVHTSLVLLRSMERGHLEGGAMLKSFFTRRAFRIYPLSILAVLVAVALHLDSNVNGVHGLSVGPSPGIGRIAANLLLIQNFTHAKPIVNVLWSLPYELQMYVMLPFLFLWNRKRQIFWPLIAFWAICIYPFSLQPNIHGLSRFGIISFFPNFLGGVIAFTLPRVARIKSYVWPFFILVLVTLFTMSATTMMGYFLCLTLGLLIPSFAEISTTWLRVASHNVATYSYGIYLSHQFCFWFVLDFLRFHSPWLKIPLLITLLAGIPVLLYHSIEKPMIRLGGNLAQNWIKPKRIPVVIAEDARQESVSA